jgi:hypothetical protein
MSTPILHRTVIAGLFAAGALGGWWTFPSAPKSRADMSVPDAPGTGATLDRRLAEAPADAIMQALREGTMEEIDEARLRKAFAAYYAAHPKEAVVIARRFADPRCVEAWYRAATELMPCEEAWAALWDIPPYLRFELSRTVVDRWAKEDGRRVMEMLLKMKPPHDYSLHPDVLQEDAFRSWAEAAPEAAATWVATSFAKDYPQNARSKIHDFFSYRTPNAGAVLKTLQNIPGVFDSPDFAESIRDLAGTFGDQSPDQALAWAKAIPDPYHRNEWLTKVAYTLPNDQALALAEEMPGIEARRSIYRVVATSKKQADRKGAEAWAQGIENPVLRQAAMEVLK